MDKFYVISNIDRDPDGQAAKAANDYLISKGKSCGYGSIARMALGRDIDDTALAKIPDDTQCAIIMGGDGTIIQAASYLAKKQIPIIGVNLGRLGFLAEIDKDSVYPALDRLMADDFFLEERMMLSGVCKIGEDSSNETLAINDIVFTRSRAMRLLNYDIYVNGRLLTTVSGDGVIVSTPTGSTGYSMSAGGPVVEPDSMVILITPISDHKLNSRPIVLSPDDEIVIKVCESSYMEENPAQVSFDGGVIFNMSVGDEVKIRRAKEITRVIKISKESFLNIISRKFS